MPLVVSIRGVEQVPLRLFRRPVRLELFGVDLYRAPSRLVWNSILLSSVGLLPFPAVIEPVNSVAALVACKSGADQLSTLKKFGVC